MATGRMNQLLVMVNLCSSVVEGIEHLMAYKENERLKEDTVTGLLTLEESLKGFMADKSVIHETKWMAEVIKTRLFVFDQEFKNRLYRWYFSALKELRNLMTAEVERCPVCSGKGVPHYGAVLYMEGGEADEICAGACQGLYEVHGLRELLSCKGRKPVCKQKEGLSPHKSKMRAAFSRHRRSCSRRNHAVFRRREKPII